MVDYSKQLCSVDEYELVKIIAIVVPSAIIILNIGKKTNSQVHISISSYVASCKL